MSRLTGRTIIAVVVAVAGAATVAAALWFIGSPSETRLRRLDTRRVRDLQQLASDVDLFWTRNGRLPATRAELPVTVESHPEPAPPGEYEYRTLDATRYELCATFDRSADSPPSRTALFWAHGAGRQCFVVPAKTVERSVQ
jgi:hypothetical protein